MMKKLTFIISDDGSFSMDMEGFHGKGCKEIASAFDSLGNVTSEETKPEFQQNQTTGNAVRTTT